MKFTEIQQDTPRLVVTYKYDGGVENFQWGIVGNIPILSLIGQVVRVQGELPMLEPGDPVYQCSKAALVITWSNSSRSFSWFVGASVPPIPLVGMLETIKQSILSTHAARQMAAQQFILGPDGEPIRS